MNDKMDLSDFFSAVRKGVDVLERVVGAVEGIVKDYAEPEKEPERDGAVERKDYTFEEKVEALCSGAIRRDSPIDYEYWQAARRFVTNHPHAHKNTIDDAFGDLNAKDVEKFFKYKS